MTTPNATILVPTINRQGSPISTAVVRTVPNGSGYVRIEDGAVLEFGIDFYPVDPNTGIATIELPQGSYYNPPLSMIIIVPGPNGGSYAGIVPDAEGPFTLENLLNGEGWAPVAQADAAVQTLAAVTYNSRGAYAGSTVYHPLDVVSFASALYQCILTTNGTQDPTNTTYWSLLLQSPIYSPASGPKITGTYPNITIGAGTLTDADVATGADIAGSKVAQATSSARGALFKSTYYLSDYATLHDALTAIGSNPARLVIHQSMSVTAADAMALSGVVTATVASGGGLPAPSTALGRGTFSTASTALVPGPMVVGTQLVMALEVVHLAGGIGSQITTAGYMSTLASIGDTITQQVVAIPANVTLDFTNGAMLAPQFNVLLAHNGAIHNGPTQVFDLTQADQSASQWNGAGCVKLNPSRCPEVWVDWFGAKGDGDGTTASLGSQTAGTDSTTGMQAAMIASSKGTGCDVNLTGGYYRVTSGVTVPNCGGYSNILIKGRGNRRSNTASGGTFIVWDGPDFATDFNGGAINPANMGPLTFPTQGSFAGLQWVSSPTSYNQFELVQYQGQMYISRVGSNLGHQPDISPTQWAPFHVPLKLWTRNCTIEGIGIGVCNTKTVAGVVWIDQDPSSTTICTQHIFKQCTLGINIDGRVNCHSIYNVIIGAFNQNNTDQHLFEDCDFSWTDWSGVHCPNKTAQVKNVQFVRCNFNPRGDGTQSQYPTYFTSGSANYRVCYSNDYQNGYWHANAFEPITFHDCTGESTNQFCHVSVTNGGTVSLVGCRISATVTNTALTNGNELVWSGGCIECDACTFLGSATNLMIRATDTISARDCTFPTLTPFFMGSGWQGALDQRGCRGIDADGSVQVMPDLVATATSGQSATVNNAGGRTTSFTAQRALTANDVVPAYASLFQPGTRGPASPIVGPGISTGGALRNSFTYKYAVTVVTSAGESKASQQTTYATTSVTPNTPTWTVGFSQIPIGPPGTIARNLYRQSQGNPITTLSTSVSSGATVLVVANAGSYQTGDQLVISQGSTSEIATVTGAPGGNVLDVAALTNGYAGATTLSGAVNAGDTSITVASATGLANNNQLTLTAPGSGAVFGTPVLSGGAVASIPILNGGSGFSSTNPPAIAITGGTGAGASATAQVTGGVITGMTLVGGAGFISAPSVSLILSETVTISGAPSGNVVNLTHAITNPAGYPSGSTAVTVTKITPAWQLVQPTSGAQYTIGDNATTTYTDTGQHAAGVLALPSTDNTGLVTLNQGLRETDVLPLLASTAIEVLINGVPAYLSLPHSLPTQSGQTPSFDGTEIVWAAPPTPSPQTGATVSDAVTNAITDAFILDHESSGTPLANFGTGLKLTAESSTTTARDLARFAAEWTNATDARRASMAVIATAHNGILANQYGVDAAGHLLSLSSLVPFALVGPGLAGSNACPDPMANWATPVRSASGGFSNANGDYCYVSVAYLTAVGTTARSTPVKILFNAAGQGITIPSFTVPTTGQTVTSVEVYTSALFAVGDPEPASLTTLPLLDTGVAMTVTAGTAGTVTINAVGAGAAAPVLNTTSTSGQNPSVTFNAQANDNRGELTLRSTGSGTFAANLTIAEVAFAMPFTVVPAVTPAGWGTNTSPKQLFLMNRAVNYFQVGSTVALAANVPYNAVYQVVG